MKESTALHIAVIDLLGFIAHNAGATDDFPMEISFDDMELAQNFNSILLRLQKLTGYEYNPPEL